MIMANIDDYRTLARKRLPRFLFEYIDGGAFSETTLRNNQLDLQQIALRQRVLRDVSSISTETTLFGQTFSLPLSLSPVGIAGLNARRGALSSIKALPRIADAVGDDLNLMLDSGMRSGLDIVRAMALGAKMVMIGRPWVYALAARQKRGVKEVIDIFAKEMRVAMALSGCTKVGDINVGMLEK